MSTRIIAVDPSLSCTGYAVLDAPEDDPVRLVRHGYIARDRKAGLGFDLVIAIMDQVTDVVSDALAGGSRGERVVYVVEGPRPSGGFSMGKRSFRSLPWYGVLVGALAFGGPRTMLLERTDGTGRIEYVTPAEWSKGLPVIGEDKYKQARVRVAEAEFGLVEGALGPKSYAGDVADAILMGSWMATCLRYEEAAGGEA